MAQFIPSKKTLKDFNDGERYLNKIDVIQAQTVNNLVEGLLFAQENGGSGGGGGGGEGSSNSVLYIPQTLSDSQKRQARENISAGTSNFSGNYNDLFNSPDLSVYAKSADLSNYVTLDTEQTITAKKSFNEQIEVWDKGILLNNDSDVPTSHLYSDRIERNYDEGIRSLYFPYKDGTISLTSDLANYVTLDTQQTISGKKYFSVKATFNDTIEVYENGEIGAVYGGTFIKLDGRNTLTFPDKSGTLLVDSDLTWNNLTGKPDVASKSDLNIYVKKTGDTMSGTLTMTGCSVNVTDKDVTSGTEYRNGSIVASDASNVYTYQFPEDSGTLLLDNQLSRVAFTGNYNDLVGAPDTGVFSVNGQTGNVWIDKDTLGLADVALTGSYDDLIDKPTAAVLSVNGKTGAVKLTASDLNLATVATSGSYTDLTNTPELGTLAGKNTVENADLSVGCVGSSELAVSAVQSANIASSAVTGIKLADGVIKAGTNVTVTRDTSKNFVISASVGGGSGSLPRVQYEQFIITTDSSFTIPLPNGNGGLAIVFIKISGYLDTAYEDTTIVIEGDATVSFNPTYSNPSGNSVWDVTDIVLVIQRIENGEYAIGADGEYLGTIPASGDLSVYYEGGHSSETATVGMTELRFE